LLRRYALLFEKQLSDSNRHAVTGLGLSYVIVSATPAPQLAG
jgi:hypothetical protein